MTPWIHSMATEPGGAGTASSILSGHPARGAKDVARLGVFLALGVVLHVVEAQIPALPLPGAKLGLANLVCLVALYLWGTREALVLVVLRQVLGSLVTGTFLSAPFWFGLVGGVVSVVGMGATLGLGRRVLSPLGVSLAGAAAHNLGQLLVAWLVTGQGAVMAYLPFLLWFSLPAGALVGWMGSRILAVLLPAAGNEGEAGPGTARTPRRPGLRPADWGVGLLVAAVGGLMLWNSLAPPTAAVAGPGVGVVSVGGREVLELPLDREQQVHLDAGPVHMVVETAGGRIRVHTSDCPDRICVRTGWIQSPGQSIVCLPGRAVVEVRGGAPATYDAITR